MPAMIHCFYNDNNLVRTAAAFTLGKVEVWLDLRSVHHHGHTRLAIVRDRTIDPDRLCIIDLHIEHRAIGRLAGPERIGYRLARSVESSTAEIVAGSKMVSENISWLGLDNVRSEFWIRRPRTEDNVDCCCCCHLVDKGLPECVEDGRFHCCVNLREGRSVDGCTGRKITECCATDGTICTLVRLEIYMLYSVHDSLD